MSGKARRPHWRPGHTALILSALVGAAVAFAALGATGAVAATWNLQPVADPPQPNGSLVSVSCPDRAWCAAVGQFTDTNGVNRPLLEVLHGVRWRSAASTATVSGGFTSISCVSRRACVAVGTASVYTGPERGYPSIAARWNGRRWQALPAPPIIEVRAVSCVASTACVAVGAGAALWDGRRWSHEPVNGPDGAVLGTVACVSASDCFAGGSYVGSSGNGIALTEHWNGRRWAVQAAYGGADDGGDASGVTSVACTSARRCVALGSASSFNSSSETTTPFSETWNGRSWSVGQPPVDGPIACVSATCATIGSGAGFVLDRSGWHRTAIPGVPQFSTGIACGPGGACVAVGALQPPGPPQTGVLVTIPAAVRWDARGWHPIAPLPGGGTQPSELRGIACPSTRACLAVGVLYANADESPLAEVFDGHAWRLASPASPTDGGVLDGVACSGPNACAAVGYTPALASGDGRHGALVEAWNGKGWAVQSTPPLAGWVELHGVSCVSATDCTAAGVQDATGNGQDPQPLFEHWDGQQWTVEPSRSSRAPATTWLFGVSCPSTTACLAVGSTLNQTTAAERWDGTSWTPAAPLNPAPSPLDNTLAAVSCAQADACMAVGAGGAGWGGNQFFGERWDGARWTIAGSAPGPVFNPGGVACPSLSSCEAVGAGPPKRGADAGPEAEGFNGATWTTQIAPGPADAMLHAVACPAPSDCFAVGTTTTDAGPTYFPLSAPLIEQYR